MESQPGTDDVTRFVDSVVEEPPAPPSPIAKTMTLQRTDTVQMADAEDAGDVTIIEEAAGENAATEEEEEEEEATAGTLLRADTVCLADDASAEATTEEGPSTEVLMTASDLNTSQADMSSHMALLAEQARDSGLVLTTEADISKLLLSSGDGVISYTTTTHEVGPGSEVLLHGGEMEQQGPSHTSVTTRVLSPSTSVTTTTTTTVSKPVTRVYGLQSGGNTTLDGQSVVNGTVVSSSSRVISSSSSVTSTVISSSSSVVPASSVAAGLASTVATSRPATTPSPAPLAPALHNTTTSAVHGKARGGGYGLDAELAAAREAKYDVALEQEVQAWIEAVLQQPFPCTSR